MLIEQIKRTAKHTITYGLGNALSPLIALLILPIFTRYLSPRDYGVIAILIIGINLLAGVIELGLIPASTRDYFEHKEIEKKKSSLITSYSLLLIINILVIGGLLIINHFFTGKFFQNYDYQTYVLIGLVIVFFQNINKVPLMYYRLLEKSLQYSLINILQITIQTVLSVILIIKFDYKVLGIIVPLLIGQVIVALIAHVHFFLKIKTKKITKSLIKPLLIYGLPFSVLIASNWIIDFSDRLLLKKFIDLDTVGIYNIGYSFALGITVITGAFITAWPVITLSLMKNKGAQYIYTKFTTYYSFAIAIPCLLISFFVKDFFTLLHPSFIEGAKVTPVIVFAYGIRGIYLILLSGIIITKKTRYQLLIEIPAMVINILLMLWWIPKYGFMGAAWSTLIAFILMPVIAYLINLKIYPILLEKIRLIKIILAIFIFMIINHYLPVGFSTVIILYKASIVILGFPSILYVFGFYSTEEKFFMKNIFRKYIFKITSSK